MARRLTHRGKTLRAYRVYREVLETADWLRKKMQGQLEIFELTHGEFRVLEKLYRDGATYVEEAARRMNIKRQNLEFTLARLVARGWVQQQEARLPPAEIEASRLPKWRRDREREGRRIVLMSLTPAGMKFVGKVFPKHAKVVKALMRALEAREQDSLSRMCQQLREGDMAKFIQEIGMEEMPEDEV
jgi:DNA-binding MarR family transcriptional regulator